jgi:hypothetical protein
VLLVCGGTRSRLFETHAEVNIPARLSELDSKDLAFVLSFQKDSQHLSFDLLRPAHLDSSDGAQPTISRTPGLFIIIVLRLTKVVRRC